MDEDEIYNKSMEAISFFKLNNILFHDLPQYGENLINLHNQFNELLNNSQISYTTGISITDLKHKKHPHTKPIHHKQIDNHLLKKSKKIN